MKDPQENESSYHVVCMEKLIIMRDSQGNAIQVDCPKCGRIK